MLDSEIKEALKEMKGPDLFNHYKLAKLLSQALKSKYVFVKEYALKTFNKQYYVKN